jgi:manganese transport protein
LIHVVETVGAMIYGRILMIMKHQSMKIIGRIQSNSVRKGFSIQLGFGKPNKVIPEIINEGNFDVLVMELMVIRDSKIYFWNR